MAHAQYFDVILDTQLTYRQGLSSITVKFLRARDALAPLLCWKSILGLKIKLLIYIMFLRPILIYGALT